MLYLAVIGTSQITQNFITDSLASDKYQLRAVLSRTTEKVDAINAACQTNARAYTTIDALAADETVDVVYIASPNALHYEQAKTLIQAGKHLIIEKPIVLSLAELDELFELAAAHQVYVFEAARHIHMPNFKQLQDYIVSQRDRVVGGFVHYQKYSSRYDQVLAGETPNIFSPDFGGGALNDLGVYLIYAIVSWFGRPNHAEYHPQRICTGVDGRGIGVLHYDDFDISFAPSKIHNSTLPNEIYFGKETLAFDALDHPTKAKIAETNDSIPLDVSTSRVLAGEVDVFHDIIVNQDDETYTQLKQIARDVMWVFDQIRVN